MKEGWEYKKFNEVFDLQMGKTPDRKTPQYFEGDNVWVSIRDLGTKEISDSNEHISDEAIVASNIRKVKKGTVIMSFKLTVGKCAIAAKNLYTNEAIMAFNLKEGYNVKPDFLYYYLRAYKWTGANKAVMGMTLNKATISQHRLGIPPLTEQQRIVEELDLLSSIIEKKKEQLKELDALAQSLFYDMFGDPVTNEKGWEVTTLNDVCISMVRGPFGSALKKEYFVEKGDNTYKIYEQKHAIQKSAIIGTYYISKEKYEELQRFEVFPNDIIMSCSGTIGELFIIPNNAEKGIMNQALLKFTLDSKKVDSFYFLFIMQYVKRNMSVHGSGLQNIGSVKTIKGLCLGLPPLPLQQQFAQKVEAIERQKELIKQSIAETETLFNSRMDYYFN